jgi:hypothetical protein
MTLEHKHIAGLELALEQWSKGWPSANYAGELRDLIAQAKAAPADLVDCACGDQYPATSYGAGFIHGSGMCENCDAALPARDIEAAPEPVQGEEVDPFAWAEFDGEGGYDLRLYENNEDFNQEYVERNGEKYSGWVMPLYTAPPAPDAELVGLLTGLVEIASKRNRGRRGSPNHGHSMPGIWDSDNGDLAGKPCAECALYDLAVDKLADLRKEAP